MGISYGHDNAADTRSASMQSSVLALPDVREHLKYQEDHHSEDEEDSFQVPIPTFTDGVTPFAYQLALRNRIKDGKLRRHGEYDMSRYTPTFIHDCLMLPGSLASLLGKLATTEITHRMTPALLPGFHAYVHSKTLEPCILQSPNHSDHVQGMLVLGQGRDSRNVIHEHYRPHCRRIKVEVEVDVAVTVPHHERDYETERWRLQRRTVWAHAWLWSNAGSSDTHFRTQVPRWNLEDYLAGALGPKEPPRIEEDGWPDAEVIIADTQYERVSQQPKREIVYGGCGSLDYIVEDHFTGW